MSLTCTSCVCLLYWLSHYHGCIAANLCLINDVCTCIHINGLMFIPCVLCNILSVHVILVWTSIVLRRGERNIAVCSCSCTYVCVMLRQQDVLKMFESLYVIHFNSWWHLFVQLLPVLVYVFEGPYKHPLELFWQFWSCHLSSNT